MPENPRNQPEKEGKVKVGIYITVNVEDIDEIREQHGTEFAEYVEKLGETLEDGIWEFPDDETVKGIASDLAAAANKVLRKW